MTLKSCLVGLAAIVLAGVLVAAPIPKEKSENLGPITDEQLKQASDTLMQIGIALHG